MPVIYMSHEVHGRKVATMELEAVYDESNGWSRYNPDMPTPASELGDELPTNALNVKRKYTRRAVTEEI